MWYFMRVSLFLRGGAIVRTNIPALVGRTRVETGRFGFLKGFRILQEIAIDLPLWLIGFANVDLWRRPTVVAAE